MLSFLLKRFFAGLLTVWVVMTLTFLLLHALPGGPFDAEKRLPPEVQAHIEAQYHLDKPLFTQYGYYLGGLVQGDLGPSYTYESQPVSRIVGQAFQVSATVGGLALLVGGAVGFFVSIFSLFFNPPWVRNGLSILAYTGLSVPSFVLAGLLVLLFSLKLHWLPAARWQSSAHAILPVASLAIVPFAYTLLWLRQGMDDILHSGFIHIKKAYGLSRWTIATEHVLRNGLLPWVAMIGPLAATLLTGSFAVEFIFALPGLGKYFITAVSDRDYPLVMGVTLIYSLLLIGLNTGSDILVGLLDPRVREGDSV